MREIRLAETRMEESDVVRRRQINEKLVNDFEPVPKLAPFARRCSLGLGGEQRLLKTD
jgi:hypothetical protein